MTDDQKENHLDQPSAGPHTLGRGCCPSSWISESRGPTLGKAVAGLNAQAKGQRLGIYSPKDEKPKEARKKRKQDESFLVEVCGRTVPAVNTIDSIRATKKGDPIEPGSVERYLNQKFDDDLDRVEEAMQKLAKAYKPKELADEAYLLYEQFRPDIPGGKKGWGAEGDLDLKLIEKLAKRDE